MAIELITKKWCDVHAQEGEQVDAETVSVSINGEKPQEVELCPECIAQYVKPLKDILTAEGRTQSKGRASGRKKTSALIDKPTASAKEVREWARSSGFDVPDRGQIPTDVREAFNAAH